MQHANNILKFIKLNMKTRLLLLASLFIGSIAQAQTHFCASHQYLQHLDKQNPGMEAAVKSLSSLHHKKSRVTKCDCDKFLKGRSI